MILLRKLLFPFAILFRLVTTARNLLYDKGILKSATFDIPTIAVGNLSVGGTGKTPQIEYLVRLLSGKYQLATLSRGYKRKSEGFVLADANATAEILGDEPFQFFRKFPNITVAVDANRKNGIEQLQAVKNPDVILLDDAFQHRKVKADFYILLTAYGDLYVDDFMLPAGNLRESRSGVKRAHVVIVTKCPHNLSIADQNNIKRRLKLQSNQRLYFTCIAYDTKAYSATSSLDIGQIRNSKKLLLAGVAKPDPFFAYLQSGNDVVMKFPDHHHFSEADISAIKAKASDRPIITTEKDFVRLKDSGLPNLYFLPIKTSFLSNGDGFNNLVLSQLKRPPS